jgi:serine/threonine-protein kinase
MNGPEDLDRSTEGEPAPAPARPGEASGSDARPGVTWSAAAAPPPKKRSLLWLWILLGLFLALVVVALVVVGVYRSNVTDVPDLRGMSVSQAARALDDVGLELGRVEYTADFPAGFAEGDVIAQTPAAGEQVDKGTPVDVTAAGEVEAEVEVPDVLGLNVDEATAALEGAGLTVKAVDVESGMEPGTVVDQSPVAGTTVAAGSEVALLVSAGMAESLVPAVVGMSQEEAVDTLETAGYEVQSKGAYDGEVAEGVVISQDPPGGTVAEPGTRVTIVVSQGRSPEVAVPDVVGQREADAAEALESAGLEPVPSPAYSDTVPAGTVMSQDPAAGATVPEGTAVIISVSQGRAPAETATVPDVVGKTEAEAVDILEDAGYEVAVARTFSETVAKDVVGAQAPVGGNVTAPGITVGLLVSDGPRPAEEFVIVPDVRGMGLEEATAALEEAGLTAVPYEFYTDLAPAGQVVAQLPPPDSAVALGSPVLLLVSKGPSLEVNPL